MWCLLCCLSFLSFLLLLSFFCCCCCYLHMNCCCCFRMINLEFYYFHHHHHHLLIYKKHTLMMMMIMHHLQKKCRWSISERLHHIIIIFADCLIQLFICKFYFICIKSVVSFVLFAVNQTELIEPGIVFKRFVSIQLSNWFDSNQFNTGFEID